MIYKFNYGLATLYSGDEKYFLQYTGRYKHLLHVYVKQTKTIGSSYQLDSHLLQSLMLLCPKYERKHVSFVSYSQSGKNNLYSYKF